MFDIKDKILLVTGGADGIGASVVKIFLEENIKHVTILDINENKGIAVEKELNTKYGGNKVKFIKCDVTQEQELLNAFSAVKTEQGYIDVVINSAGILDEKNFAKAFEINVTALIRSTLQAWDLMRKDKGGRGGTVINIASMAAIGHYPVLSVYSATKAAVVKFSTALGDELNYAKTGIRIISACFGVTDTKLIQEKVPSFDPDFEEAISSLLRSHKWQSYFDEHSEIFVPEKIRNLFDTNVVLRPEEAAQGVLEMYKHGNSGSVWAVTRGKPAVDVTETYMQSFKAFDDVILN